MPLERIRVDGFRILSNVDCRLHPQRNYFFGPNGAGKTSLLEAVHLIGRGRSFRTRHTRRLIQHGREHLAVYAEYRAPPGSGQGHGELHRIGVQVGGEGIAYRIDRQPAPSVTAVARMFSVDVIDPSVHRLIEGGPTERRRFVDWGVFHVEPGYLDTWRRYRRVLGQRNAALKAAAAPGVLAPWNQALEAAGEAVSRARARYVEMLGHTVEAVARRLVGRPVRVEYRRGWRVGISLGRALAESEERDRAAGFTQAGPHRADLAIRVNGGGVAEEASRGQQKLVAAALVIAQVAEASAAAGRDGVLLIDDPAAELDRDALQRLLGEVESLPCQLVLTGLAPELLPVDARFPVFHVEQGRIAP